jgi:hypothetical protein
MLLQDSVATPPPPVASAMARVHEIVASTVPNVWIMVGLTVGLLVLIVYMLRVPHDYPFRGAAMAFASLGFLACAVVTGLKLWDRMPHQVPGAPDARADTMAIEKREADQREAEKEPVSPLETYVQPMPGTDALSRHDQPSVGGLPGGTVWDETTTQSIQDVVRYYSDNNNHYGWQLELSAPSGVVLRRTVTSQSGQPETERMRVQAFQNPDHQSKQRTEIEFELTRRLK